MGRWRRSLVLRYSLREFCNTRVLSCADMWRHVTWGLLHLRFLTRSPTWPVFFCFGYGDRNMQEWSKLSRFAMTRYILKSLDHPNAAFCASSRGDSSDRDWCLLLLHFLKVNLRNQTRRWKMSVAFGEIMCYQSFGCCFFAIAKRKFANLVCIISLPNVYPTCMQLHLFT